MADKRTLKINSLDPDNKVNSTTISNVNTSSDTTVTAMTNFTKGLIGLTNDTYVSTTQIDETKLD